MLTVNVKWPKVTWAVQKSQKLTKCKLEWFRVLANNLDLFFLFWGFWLLLFVGSWGKLWLLHDLEHLLNFCSSFFLSFLLSLSPQVSLFSQEPKAYSFTYFKPCLLKSQNISKKFRNFYSTYFGFGWVHTPEQQPQFIKTYEHIVYSWQNISWCHV